MGLHDENATVTQVHFLPHQVSFLAYSSLPLHIVLEEVIVEKLRTLFMF